MKKQLLVLFSLYVLSCSRADAFFVTKLIGLALKPVTIPLGIARRAVFGGVSKLVGKGTKAGKVVLSGLSMQAGPVKVRPFDYH